MTDSVGTYRYRAFGLEIESPLPLPELYPSDDLSPPDVLFKFGHVTPHPDGNIKRERIVSIEPSGPHYYWRDIVNIHVENGSSVIIDPLENASEIGILAPLVGVVMGAILHARKIFALHASCVELNGKAMAFLGDKGDGKSTITASLISKGCRLISDDILAFDMKELALGRPVVIPSYPQLKIATALTDVFELSQDSIFPLDHVGAKVAYRRPDLFGIDPAPLAQINFLSFGAALMQHPISGRNALLALLRHSYSARALSHAGNTKADFQSALKLQSCENMYVLTRPRDLSQLSAVADHVISSLDARPSLI